MAARVVVLLILILSSVLAGCTSSTPPAPFEAASASLGPVVYEVELEAMGGVDHHLVKLGPLRSQSTHYPDGGFRPAWLRTLTIENRGDPETVGQPFARFAAGCTGGHYPCFQQIAIDPTTGVAFRLLAYGSTDPLDAAEDLMVPSWFALPGEEYTLQPFVGLSALAATDDGAAVGPHFWGAVESRLDWQDDSWKQTFTTSHVQVDVRQNRDFALKIEGELLFDPGILEPAAGHQRLVEDGVVKEVIRFERQTDDVDGSLAVQGMDSEGLRPAPPRERPCATLPPVRLFELATPEQADAYEFLLAREEFRAWRNDSVFVGFGRELEQSAAAAAWSWKFVFHKMNETRAFIVKGPPQLATGPAPGVEYEYAGSQAEATPVGATEIALQTCVEWGVLVKQLERWRSYRDEARLHLSSVLFRDTGYRRTAEGGLDLAPNGWSLLVAHATEHPDGRIQNHPAITLSLVTGQITQI